MQFTNSSNWNPVPLPTAPATLSLTVFSVVTEFGAVRRDMFTSVTVMANCLATMESGSLVKSVMNLNAKRKRRTAQAMVVRSGLFCCIMEGSTYQSCYGFRSSSFWRWKLCVVVRMSGVSRAK
jgi:hypothetical protein